MQIKISIKKLIKSQVGHLFKTIIKKNANKKPKIA